MATSQVICIGEILWDCLADQPGRELVDVASWTAYPGGAPANVACALAKLGTAAAFVGCIGQDPPGDQLVSLLAETGVEIKGVQRSTEAPTRQVYVTRSLSGERQFAGFGGLNTDGFADTQLLADPLPAALWTPARFLVTGTLELAYPHSRAAIERAVRLAQQAGAEVFVDVNWRPIFWRDPGTAKPSVRKLLGQADWIKCTDQEARWLFGTQAPADIAEIFPQAKGVLVTAGEQGCTYWINHHPGQVEAFAVEVVDTTGAGDSFVAGLLHFICHQDDRLSDAESIRGAVVYASAVGALTTTAAGAIAAQPTAQQVDALLNSSCFGQ